MIRGRRKLGPDMLVTEIHDDLETAIRGTKGDIHILLLGLAVGLTLGIRPHTHEITEPETIPLRAI